VILPVYNVSKYVRAAVDSVLSQSFSDFELLVIDDGCTDDTLRELEQLRDPRVAVLHQSHSGLPVARNAGVLRARGAYIAFMDGDDLWFADRLQKDVEYLDAHAEADLVFSGLRMIDEEGRDLGRTDLQWTGVLTLRDLLLGNIIGSDGVLLRRTAREQAGWFDEQLPVGSDYDYWLRVALLRPNNLHGLKRISVLYRRHSGQVTRDWRLHERSWRQVMAKMQQRCPDEVAAVEKKASANLYRALAASAYEGGELPAAARLFSRAVGLAPWFLLWNRRTWWFGSALVSALILPQRVHSKIVELAIKHRARRSASNLQTF
jgi:glycosyltransferase involved in cell wall biosynthesis